MIELVSTSDIGDSSTIAFYSDTYLGQRKDSTPVHGITPIEGSPNVETRLRANNWVQFSDSINGNGDVVIYPYMPGQSIGIESYTGDFSVWGLDKLASTFNGLFIGGGPWGVDSEGTAGITSDAPIKLTTWTAFSAGTGALSFSQPLDSSGQDVVFDVAQPSSVAELNLGTGNLWKAGSGSLNLTTANSYEGATSIYGGGKLQISHSSGLGNTTSLVLNDGTLHVSAPISGATGTVELGPYDGVGGAVDVDAGQSFVYNGVVFGEGSLTKQGEGDLELAGANTYTGATDIEQGRLIVTGASPVPPL